MLRRKDLFALICCVCLVVDAKPSSPKYGNKVTEYRLSKDVIPEMYDIKLTLNSDFSTTEKFDGHVEINCKVLKETNTVTLNADKEIGPILAANKDNNVVVVVQVKLVSEELTDPGAPTDPKKRTDPEKPTNPRSKEKKEPEDSNETEAKSSTKSKNVVNPIDSKIETSDTILENESKYDEVSEILTITLKDTVEPSASSDSWLIIKLKYTGKLYDDMHGFYLSKHKYSGNDEEYLATTQFESTFARRAFPSFDEPSFKAKFTITIAHEPEYTALSNQPASSSNKNEETGLMETKFKETAKMSTYSVAFIVSKFKELKVPNNAQDGSSGKPMSIFVPDGLEQTAEFAQEKSRKILNTLEIMLKIPYWGEDMIEKLDQVAIPDFSAGAMENWGLVTYRETALLWGPKTSTTKDKQRILTVIAHEFAHNWFGNLVTMDWWKDTWLNEGFANFFEYRAGNTASDGEFELDKQFLTDELQSVMVVDGNKGSLPLSSPEGAINNLAEIQAKFGSITYSKGGCIVRMMEDIVGGNFFDALNSYLLEFKFGNTQPADLFKHLSAKSDDLKMDVLMDAWINKPGYPMVYVTLKEERAKSKVTVNQTRFHYIVEEEEASEYDEDKWNIKVNYEILKKETTSKDDKVKSKWLMDNEDSVELTELSDEDVILVNPNQFGYYRVNYDEELWSRIIDVLHKEHTKIDVMTRTQLIDDVMNLARANIVNYESALEVLLYTAKEVEYYPWKAAFTTLSYVRRRISDETLNGKITKLILDLMDKLYKEHGSFEIKDGEKPIKIYSQVLTLQWACELNMEKCYTEAVDLFENKFDKIQTDVKSIVYCAALRHEEANEDGKFARWEKLWEKYKSSKSASEKSTILTSLGCTQNKESLQKLLDLSLKNDEIRSQDALSAFKAVLTGNPQGAVIAFNFLKEKYAEIHQKYGSLNVLSSILLAVSDRITDETQLKEFEEFIEENKDDLEDGKLVADNAIAGARANLKWAKKSEEQLTMFFKKRESSSADSLFTSHVLVLGIASLLGQYFFNGIF